MCTQSTDSRYWIATDMDSVSYEILHMYSSTCCPSLIRLGTEVLSSRWTQTWMWPHHLQHNNNVNATEYHQPILYWPANVQCPSYQVSDNDKIQAMVRDNLKTLVLCEPKREYMRTKSKRIFLTFSHEMTRKNVSFRIFIKEQTLSTPFQTACSWKIRHSLCVLSMNSNV